MRYDGKIISFSPFTSFNISKTPAKAGVSYKKGLPLCCVQTFLCFWMALIVYGFQLLIDHVGIHLSG